MTTANHLRLSLWPRRGLVPGLILVKAGRLIARGAALVRLKANPGMTAPLTLIGLVEG